MKRLLNTCLIVCCMLVCVATNAQISGLQDVCLNTTAYYSNTGASYSIWTVSGGNPIVTTPSGSAQILWTHTGMHTITAVHYNGSAFDTSTISVTVHPLPTPEIIPQNINSCVTISPAEEAEDPRRGPGEDVCYTVCDSGWYYYRVQGDVGSTYEWSTSANGEIVELNGSGDSVKVRWAGEGYTSLTVTETTVEGCVATVSICIKIISVSIACLQSAPLPTAGVINLCLGANLSMNSACSQSMSGADIVTRTWIMGDGTVYNNDSYINHVYSLPGTYTVKFIVESNCGCADTITRTVLVDSTAGPDIYCVNTVCHNTTSIFTTSSTCGTLVWTVEGEDSYTTNEDSIIINWGDGTSGYGLVSLLADCEGACPYPTEIYVPILPDTTVVSGDSVVCNYETTVYSVPYIPATIYTWCNPLVTTSCVPVLDVHGHELAWDWGLTSGTLPQNNIYKVRVTYTNPFLGCSGYAELPITVAGQYTLHGDTVICEAENDTIQAFGLDGSPLNCNWTLYEQGTNAVVYTASGVGTVILSSLAAGTYSLVVNSVSPYFCNNPEILSIRVVAAPPTPTGPILGPDTVCANSLQSYFTTAAASGCYLQWEAIAGTPSIGIGQQFNTIWSGALPSTLKLRHVLLAEPGCTSAWLSQNIYAEVVAIDGINGRDTVCANDTVTYSLNTTADRYTWSLSDAEKGSVISGQFSNTVVIQWNHYTGSPVTVQVNVQIEKCGQVIDTVLDVLLNPYATATVQADTAPFCSGEKILFTASSGTYYAWDFGDGSTTTRSLDTATYQYADSGTFFVKVIVQNPYGCSSPATAGIAVNILPGPVALLSTEDPIAYCGQPTWSVDLNTTLQEVPGATYTYTLLHNGVVKAGPGSTSNFTVNQTSYGPGSYTVLVSNGGCSRTTNAIVIDTTCSIGGCSPQEPLTFVIDDEDCGTVDVTASYSSPVTFTHFNFGEPGSSTNVVAANPASHTYKKAGHYTISVTGDDGDGCPTGEQHVVTVPLVADFMVQYACSSNVMKVTLVDLSTFIGNDIDTWQWYIDGSPTYTCNTQACSPALSAGTHTIRLVVNNGGGVICEITKTIDVPATATASFTSLDSVCETQAVHFISTSTGDIVSYYWQHDDGSGSVLLNSSRDYEVNVVSPAVFDKFYPTLTITDVYGCSSIKKDTIVVYDNKLDAVVLNITPSNIVGCMGESELIAVNVFGSPTTTPYTYVWSNGASNTFASFPFNYNVTATGELSVKVTDKYGCQLAGGPVTAYFEEINAGITGDTIYCKGEAMNLSIFAGHQYTYTWLAQYPGSPAIVTHYPGTYPYLVDDIMNNDGSLGPIYDGTVFWGIVTSVNGCSDTVGPVTVHQYTNVSSNITYGLSSVPPCLNNGPVTLTLSSPSADGFVWSNGVYGNTITFTTPGTYTLQMIDSNGCYKDPSEFKIPAGPDFSQLITGCYTRCLGQPTTLYGPYAPLGHTYTYQWLRDGNIAVGTTQNINVSVSGAYTLVIHDAEGSFTCTDTSKIIDIDFVVCPDAYCAEDTNISCISCFKDSLSNARIMTVIVNLSYTGSTETTYTVSSSTAEIYNPENMHGIPIEYIGNHIRPGANSIHIDVADTAPFQTYHTIVVAIGDCYIPITLTTPVQCAESE